MTESFGSGGIGFHKTNPSTGAVSPDNGGRDGLLLDLDFFFGGAGGAFTLLPESSQTTTLGVARGGVFVVTSVSGSKSEAGK